MLLLDLKQYNTVPMQVSELVLNLDQEQHGAMILHAHLLLRDLVQIYTLHLHLYLIDAYLQAR